MTIYGAKAAIRMQVHALTFQKQPNSPIAQGSTSTYCVSITMHIHEYLNEESRYRS